MRLRILAVLYTLAIVTVTLLPSGGDTLVAGWDTRITPDVQNTLHLPAYIVLVVLLMAAFGRGARRPWLTLGLITLGCIMLGIVTEWLQAAYVPGRYGSLTDALSNTIGCLLGAVVSYQLTVVSNTLPHKTNRASASLSTVNCQLSTSSTILCFASGYEAPPTSKHHVMHVLAEQGNTVLWVNYHASRVPTASGADLLHIVRKLRQVAGGLKNPRKNVYVLTPLVVPLPGSRLARWLNRTLLVGQIRRALRKIAPGPNTPLELWSFTPDVAYLLDRFGQRRVVYYCVDDHSQFTGYDAAQVLRDEEALCRRADLVVTTSGPLQASRKAWNPNTILVPHGVDYEHFARAVDDNLPEPAELAAIPRPRLGFFGLLRDWVDLDLLAEVARRRPNWHMVLLGDATVDLGPYRSLGNMHFLGPKPYAELPAWCRGFDVGLIPFKLNALTHAVNPIKLREYLAAGLPVVSTPLPEVERYAQGVGEGVRCQVSGVSGGGVDSDALPSECVSEEERDSASRTPNSELRTPIHPASASGPEGAARKRLLTPFPPSWVSLADGPDAWTTAIDAILRPGAAEAGRETVDSGGEVDSCQLTVDSDVLPRKTERGEEGVGCQVSGVSGEEVESDALPSECVGEEERDSASPASSSQLPASASDRAMRSAAMRSETWQEKVDHIREELAETPFLE